MITNGASINFEFNFWNNAMMEEGDVVEHFFGVYLLYCTNPKYKGRTYIGYTVDPNRRIKQHNRGKHAGGAWKTSNRGPWEMVMIIHGFPNNIAALRFEWAWQHPERSRRLNHVPKKRYKEKTFDFNLRVLSEMLCVGPWSRLPLTIRWLSPDYSKSFPSEKPPPLHMPVTYGGVVSKKITPNSDDDTKQTQSPNFCCICGDVIDKKPLKCLNPKCGLVSHIICLANTFLEADEYIPIEGKCPECHQDLLWGDLIRKHKGCYGDLNINITNDMGDDFYSSDSE